MYTFSFNKDEFYRESRDGECGQHFITNVNKFRMHI